MISLVPAITHITCGDGLFSGNCGKNPKSYIFFLANTFFVWLESLFEALVDDLHINGLFVPVIIKPDFLSAVSLGLAQILPVGGLVTGTAIRCGMSTSLSPR